MPPLPGIFGLTSGARAMQSARTTTTLRPGSSGPDCHGAASASPDVAAQGGRTRRRTGGGGCAPASTTDPYDPAPATGCSTDSVDAECRTVARGTDRRLPARPR